MSQPNLFGVPDAYGGFTPIAGRTDPLTSHESARRVSKSARAELHRKIAIAIVLRIHRGTREWNCGNWQRPSRKLNSATTTSSIENCRMSGTRGFYGKGKPGLARSRAFAW